MNAIQIIRLIAALLPIIQQVIHLVEATFSGHSSEEKKSEAMGLIESTWGFLANEAGIKELRGFAFADLKPIVSFLVDTVVSVFNRAGIFSK
jgi:hypothetical protein